MSAQRFPTRVAHRCSFCLGKHSDRRRWHRASGGLRDNGYHHQSCVRGTESHDVSQARSCPLRGTGASESKTIWPRAREWQSFKRERRLLAYNDRLRGEFVPDRALSSLTQSSRCKTLTGILPYGDAQRDSVIVFLVVRGGRPSRPTDTWWLQDQIWDMMVTCWSERREQRWGIRDVCNRFWESSAQEIPSVEPGDFTTEPRSSPQPPKDYNPFRALPLPADYEPFDLPPSTAQQPTKSRFLKWRKNSRPQTVPVPNTPTPKRRFAFPTIFRAGRGNNPGTDQTFQGGRSQKTTILSRGLQALVNSLARFMRLEKSPGTGGAPQN